MLIGGVFGMDHFINTTEWMVSYDDGRINFDETGKVLWDINDDRIMMDIRSYETWSRHVFPEELQCFGKDVKYRHHPFTVKVDVEALVNMEGRYKFTTFFRPYDEHNRLRPKLPVWMFRAISLKSKHF
ncbi:uncharacterized protein ACN427_014371 isoform 1-T1 [Glossina fuscipes fuscipes]